MLFLTSYPSHYFSNCFSRILKLVLTATHCLFSELCDYIFSYTPLREVCQSFKQMNGSLQWKQEFAARKKNRIRFDFLKIFLNFKGMFLGLSLEFIVKLMVVVMIMITMLMTV